MALTVSLNGNNYVSEKTRQAFETALEDGPRVKGNGDGNGHTSPSAASLTTSEFSQWAEPQSAPPPQTVYAAPQPDAGPDYEHVMESVERSLARAFDHQHLTLRAHEQYLSCQADYAKIFAQVMQQQGEIFTAGSATPQQTATAAQVLESLAHSIARFHDIQAETLNIHKQFLSQQGEYTRATVELLQQGALASPRVSPGNGNGHHPVTAPDANAQPIAAPVAQPAPVTVPEPPLPVVAATPTPTPTLATSPASGDGGSERAPAPPSRLPAETLTRSLLDVVSDKTGYPAEMLDLTMDMEADLGIDSIKRVEILGALQDLHPDGSSTLTAGLPEFDADALAELRTLGQIVEYMGAQAHATSPAPGDGGGEQSPPRLPAETLTRSLLDIVSDKTGYPAEMLDLTMDMEADLGIDSIKRVEILGALQDLHPDGSSTLTAGLPEFDADALAELRTLGQIVEYMGAQAHATSPAPVPGGGEQSPPRLPAETLTRSLLDIVSDKTGYPAEMLDLTMDMEADLGIDSIKRVEILGALQDLHPDGSSTLTAGLPEFSADVLAELRTLGQIVEYMATQSEAQTDTDKKKAIASDAPDVTQALARDHNPAPPPALQRLEVRLRPLSLPDRLENAPSPSGVWIVTDDGAPATGGQTSSTLAQALIARGQRVALLRFPTSVIPERSPVPEGVREITLEDLSEAHLAAQLATVGPVTGFIHVEPGLGRARSETGPSSKESGAGHTQAGSETGPSGEYVFPASTKARLKHVFLIAKHLKSALHANAREGRACFVTVTRMNGALGLGETTDGSPELAVNFDPVAGGFAGLTKTLSLEWPTVFCRAVDIAPQFDAAQTAQAILAELNDPNRRLTEVGHGPHGRVTLEARSKRQEARGKKQEAGSKKQDYLASCILHPASCLLVSGGGRGITAQCVIKLAERYGGTYILLGRSSIEAAEPAWAAGVEDEATLKQHAFEAATIRGERLTPAQVQREINALLAKREIEGTLRAVEGAGGRAAYLSVDVTDGATLSAAVENAVGRLDVRVTGILHGAGVLADKRIEHKTGDDFERVYAAKVTGLENLLACVPAEQLEHLILFSSVAGFYGNVGQADYALANDILNKTAHLVAHRHPNCRALAIDWGPWDGGMVTPQLKRLFAERNIDVIPIKAGTTLLADELAPDAPRATQIVVGASLVAPAPEPDGKLHTHRLQRALTLDANPFLRDHVIGGQAVLPTVCAVAWMVNACEQLYPGYTFFSADEYKALKGIVFNETLADEYTLELKETVKTHDELVFEGLILSQTPEGKPRYHYSARITLLRQVPDAPVFAAFGLDEMEAIPGERLYTEKTLFHGPAFRGVERVLNIGPRGLTMRCLLPEVGLETQGQFPVQTFNPYLTDVQLQSLLIWAARFKQSPGLPLRIQRGEQFRPVRFGEPVYATLTVQSSSDTSLVADVTVHDAQGVVYSRVTGAEITLSARLTQLFQQNQV